LQEVIRGAVHASAQALANASPNSRVGKIAAYRDANALAVTAAEAAAMAEESAVAALEAAANKPVTDEVRNAVDALLIGK